MKYPFLFLFFLWNTAYFFGQQPAYFTLGKEQFEGVQIYSTIQDKNHNYWFATDKGFYKYNSYTFEKIDCDGMKGLSAFGFVINKTGTIFCHNLNHQLIKIENNQCSVFYELTEAERSSDMSLAISEENNLVVVARIPILFDAKGKLIKAFNNHPGAFSFPFHTRRGAIIYHASGKDSLLEIYQNKIVFKPLKYTAQPQINPLIFLKINNTTYAISNKDKRIYSFNEDSYECTPLKEQSILNLQGFLRFYNLNNDVWIAGTAAGVRRLEGENAEDLSEQMYSGYFISYVYKDNEGNILLSTFNNGVLVVPELKIQDVLKLPQHQAITSVHIDEDMGIILGSSEGELISFRNSTFHTLSNKGNKPLQSINSWPGFRYIIYDDGQVKAYDKKTRRTICLFEGSLKDASLLDSNSIFLALNSGIQKLNPSGPGKFKHEAIASLDIRTYAVEVEKSTKNIFVATSDGLRIIKPDNKIERPLFEGSNPFANDLFYDEDLLYVATKKHGILIFRQGKVIRKLISKLNQKEIEVHKLIVNKNKIYVNSSEGFIVLAKSGNILAKLNKVQGFATNKIFDFGIIQDQIWIIHSKGFQKININQLTKPKEIPLLELSRIAVNDQPLKQLDKDGAFDSEQRKIQFTISSPTLRNKENIRYHYKLTGYETTWSVSDYEDNEISYNALAPGKYTFEVKAENQGIYSELKTYSFVISAPFYYRWWFISLEFIVFFLMVALVYRWQLKLQRKKSEQQNELNASKLTAIKSQMNPHFIFNALNSIQDLILKGDVENSYSYITTFSNMVRKTLKYSDREFIEINQEIKLLELYLSLEKLRFKKDLDYEIISDSMEDLMIPPLLIQPFIENALVHGLLHKEGKKQLSIAFKFGELCTCIIQDNGIGREKAKLIKQRQGATHESFSGRAIQKRFEILSKTLGGNFGYLVEDVYVENEISGTRVIIQLPVKQKF
ncbi:hypothetical protein CNR22_13680 [Sphingobacteriaceae bacterium]|nr:hypothetical protein CNR22_13680 [Sphingobacteriaceae bacterium]